MVVMRNVLRISNMYGNHEYTVAFHDEDGEMGPIVGFYPDGWRNLRIGAPFLYSYYTFTLLDHEGGLMLDGGNTDHQIDDKEMNKVRAFIIQELRACGIAGDGRIEGRTYHF
jgi:hypothetical protein